MSKPRAKYVRRQQKANSFMIELWSPEDLPELTDEIRNGLNDYFNRRYPGPGPQTVVTQVVAMQIQPPPKLRRRKA